MTERAALLEDINPAAVEAFEAADWDVELFPKSITVGELTELAQESTVLGVRSGPRLPAEVAGAAGRLQVVGCFSAGYGHIDVEAASRAGVAVFNAAEENTRSVTEYVLGSITSMLRRLPAHNRSLHDGVWSKTDEGSHELWGKKLGVVGLGMIGSKVATLLDGLGMDVLFYDIDPKQATHGRVKRAGSLGELLTAADVVTLHTPGDQVIMDARTLGIMKKGSYLINASRGGAVDIDALVAVIDSGHLAGCTLDVFEDEPKKRGDAFEHPLRGYPNVLLTPHIGGSTEEAQTEIGRQVAGRILQYVADGSVSGSVNLPTLRTDALEPDNTRLLHTHENTAGALEGLTRIVADADLNIVAVHGLKVKDWIGYTAIDIAGDVPEEVIGQIEAEEHTIRVRTIR